MVLFIILGMVVLLAIGVLGVLFLMLSKEGHKAEEKAVALTDLDQIKKEFSSVLLEPQKAPVKAPDVIPPFEPRVSMPLGEVKVPAEDDVYKKRAEELEEELKGISVKAQEQLDEAKLMIENLSEENESLKRQKSNLQEAQEKLSDLQTEANGLKTENSTLQSQLEATDAKVRLLEEQMTAVRLQMGEEIAKANATVTELTQEKENLLSAPKPEVDNAVSKELEALKTEQAQLKLKYDELDKEYHKARDMNVHLIEKNDQMQYEMVKARAQSSGLERISENYKVQIEDFFKKMNALQVTNDHLSQVKNKLEGMIEEIKLQNDDLAKKDQLNQFELEKNRSRMANLERENEELKARAQQGDR